ncbi:MAG: MurT ligase domain-containing protein [bacterium]
MRLKYLPAFWFTKITILLLKLLGRSQGTALPGLLMEQLAPDSLNDFTDQLKYTILITGTNGKTTTQSILSNIFKASKLNYIANKSGSNMIRGILSTFINQSNWLGKIKPKYGIFEIEEATLPKIVTAMNPKQIIVTNLFRDQLDAYGEIDRTEKFIREALEKAPQAVAILNADDPRVALLTRGFSNQTLYFSLNAPEKKFFKYEGLSLEKLEIVPSEATELKINPNLSTSFKFLAENYTLKLPGIHNVYNVLAAVLAARLLKIKTAEIHEAVLETLPAFGRGEILKLNNTALQILLIKNPAGLNLTLELLTHTKNSNLIMILNDNIADGRDVSWIWDAELEILNKIQPAEIIVSGKRAWDMLLRIKYVFSEFTKKSENLWQVGDTNIKIIPEQSDLILFLNSENQAKHYFVLPTYTAMLEFRKLITGKAIVA